MFPARCWLAALSTLSLVLTSCVSTPDSYGVPPQHLPFRPNTNQSDFVAAADPLAARFFVRDINTELAVWRWTGAEPELRFTLDSIQNRKLVYYFVINETTFKDTGPLTISFFVNKHLLGRERYDAPGEKTFEKAVPAEWLKAGEESHVIAHIENPWHAPDGLVLGILLQRAGLVQ